MGYLYDSVRFLHVLAVVFMAAPLYNLIVVNERVRFGPAPFAVDRYFENIIKGAASRCYIYQLTALGTGLLLLFLSSLGWSALWENPALAAKFILLLVLMGLLSVVHFRLQPAIEALLGQVRGETIPPEILSQLAPLRLQRKRLAGLCLFLVITLVLLGLQVYKPFGFWVSGGILALAALFTWRVYKTPIRFGWI